MLRRSREEFYKCLGTDTNQSPKRLWSTLKRNSKTRSIPDKEHTENYCPISLLCITSKVLESCILNNIKCRLLDIVNICQHGFIAGRSCMTNLLETLDYVGSCLDNGGLVDIIYMDMSKVFNKVDHGLFIQKLRNDFGIGGNLLKWFQSYLENCKQLLQC